MHGFTCYALNYWFDINLIVFPIIRLVREPDVYPCDYESVWASLIPSDNVFRYVEVNKPEMNHAEINIRRYESCNSLCPITGFVYLKFGTIIIHVERPYSFVHDASLIGYILRGSECTSGSLFGSRARRSSVWLRICRKFVNAVRFCTNPSWSFIRWLNDSDGVSICPIVWKPNFHPFVTCSVGWSRTWFWVVFRDIAALWFVRLLFFNILSFAWIWVYFRFFAWFESKTFIRLTPNRSEDCELVRFLLYSNISNLDGYD